MSSAAPKISMSALADTKMILHATKNGFSNPIHGIIIGKKSSSGGDSLLEIVDAIPVCHEVPTKPIVDMALRLCDAHFLQTQCSDNDLAIIGWYTSNASTSDDELPNPSACRIASSMSDNGEEGDPNFILVLVTTTGIVAAVSKDSEDSTTTSSAAACRVFLKDTKTNTFSQEVDSSLISSENVSKELITNALSKGLPIYDYVDHISSYGCDDDWKDMDWITNDAINCIAK